MFSYSKICLVLLLFGEKCWTGLHQGTTCSPAATLGLQDSRLKTDDCGLLLVWTAFLAGWRPTAILRDWLNLFWLQDLDIPLICGYLCIYQFITPKHFQFNRRELLIPTYRCPPVYRCNGYRRRIWTRRHEFKSWTWLIAFHIGMKGMNPNILPPAMGK